MSTILMISNTFSTTDPKMRVTPQSWLQNTDPKIIMMKSKDEKFWKLLRKEVFFDKTLLIKTVLETDDRALLITAPQGFFKRSNSLMLTCFFKMDLDDNGAEIEDTRICKYEIFKTMKIGEHVEILDQHLGRYPVLHIDLSELHGYGGRNCLSAIFVSVFRKFAFLNNSDALSHEDRKEYHKLSNYASILPLSRTPNDLFLATKRICALLRKHCNRKVYVIIDQYDHLIVSGMNGSVPMNPLFHYMRNFYANLIDNENIQCLFLTGVSNILRIDGFTEYRFPYGNPFTPYYGIVQDDINSALVHCPSSYAYGLVAFMHKIEAKILEMTSRYYITKGKKIRVYSPWTFDFTFNGCSTTFSRLLCVFRCSKVFEVPQIRSTLQKLLKDEKVVLHVQEQFNIDDVLVLYYACRVSNPIFSQQCVVVFFTFLLHLGVIAEAFETNERIRKQFGFQPCVLYYIPNEPAHVFLLTMMTCINQEYESIVNAVCVNV